MTYWCRRLCCDSGGGRGDNNGVTGLGHRRRGWLATTEEAVALAVEEAVREGKGFDALVSSNAR